MKNLKKLKVLSILFSILLFAACDNHDRNRNGNPDRNLHDKNYENRDENLMNNNHPASQPNTVPSPTSRQPRDTNVMDTTSSKRLDTSGRRANP